MERKKKIQISQDAFDALVQENINDFDMDQEEAIEDAIQTFQLQGADLSGIITNMSASGDNTQHPIIISLNEIRTRATDLGSLCLQDAPDGGKLACHMSNQLADAFEEFHAICSGKGLDNVFIAIKNGAIELAISICAAVSSCNEKALISTLKVLALLLPDLESTERFRKNDGSKTLVGILEKYHQKVGVVEQGCAVVAAAVTGNEVVKEEFMELKIEDLLMKMLRLKDIRGIESIYDVIRILVTADDNRVLASQAYTYARRFAKIGIVEVLIKVAQQECSSISLLSTFCTTLRSTAVNDEICKSIAESDGLDVVLQFVAYSMKQMNKSLAKTACSLLIQLAGSDSNKDAIVSKGGINILIDLATVYMDEPSVLQEMMGTIRAITLRSPTNAAKSVESGVADIAIEAMERHPSAYLMQNQACLMIRNLVARNPENRIVLLEKNLDKLIRVAKKNHECCKDAASAALRDLGLDDYNA